MIFRLGFLLLLSSMCPLTRCRLTKEEKTYVKEAEEQKQRVQKYIDDGKDEWHVNKQVGTPLFLSPEATWQEDLTDNIFWRTRRKKCYKTASK